MRGMAMKTLLLVAPVGLLLMACGDLASGRRVEKLPVDVAVPHEAQAPIERTIENFTLGMEKDEAFALFASAIKQENFTLLYMGNSLPDTFTSHFEMDT